MIDILLATYNSKQFLNEQIDSIIAQDYTNWRLIVRDAGSSDNTINILQKYQQKLGTEKFIIINNNKPSSSLENFCELLKYSDSEYIMFCDHDDVWLPNKISLSLHHLQKIKNQKQPLIVFSDKKVVDENLNLLNKSFFRYSKLNPYKLGLNNLITQNVASGCTMLFNNALLKIIDIDVMKKCAVMHDHWLMLVAKLFGEISYLNQPTILYRQHKKNVLGAPSFMTKLKRYKNFHDRFRESCKQCQGILDNYGDKIDGKTTIMLKKFTDLPNCNFFRKRYIILKYRFFKHGLLRNLGVFFLI
ncbi:glycosyltransferase family 2 protein [Lentisphaerota bacterium WC36G]|nr:glycosyltransferase family 2 protein [Lentisphaerae bacterium WC36]